MPDFLVFAVNHSNEATLDVLKVKSPVEDAHDEHKVVDVEWHFLKCDFNNLRRKGAGKKGAGDETVVARRRQDKRIKINFKI